VLRPAAESVGSGDQFTTYISVNMHAMNIVALLTDFLLNDVTFSVDDIWILMLWPTWYDSIKVASTSTMDVVRFNESR
jgi:hypothetical protein